MGQNKNTDLTVIVDRFFDGLYESLSEIGKEAIEDARDAGTYDNQSGRLRNASGYALTDQDGDIIEMNTVGETNPIQGTANPLEGSAKTRAYIRSIPSNRTVSLILANGMPYTTYVEAKGRNVISSSALKMMADVNTRLVRKLKNKK